MVALPYKVIVSWYHYHIRQWFHGSTTILGIVGSYVNFSGKVREVRSIFFVRLKCV